jgi:hypothetical protein
MKRIVIIVLLSIIAASAIAKTAPYTITTIDLAPKHELYNTKEKTIHYPIFHFADKAIEKKINRKIRVEFLEDLAMPDDGLAKYSDKALLKLCTAIGLTELLVDSVTYVNDNFISFRIYYEWMGAYPYGGRKYFVFDLTTGKMLTINDLIKPDKQKAFRKLIIAKQRKIIKDFREASEARVAQKEISQENLDFIKTQIESDCLDNFDSTKFSIFEYAMEIIVDCGFPHVVLDLENHSNIIISKKELQYFIDERFKY